MTHNYGYIEDLAAQTTVPHNNSKHNREPAHRPQDNFQLCLRINPDNPRHHLWNNNGTWYIHYTTGNAIRAERVRFSLHTKNLATAQRRRDAILRRQGANQ